MAKIVLVSRSGRTISISRPTGEPDLTRGLPGVCSSRSNPSGNHEFVDIHHLHENLNNQKQISGSNVVRDRPIAMRMQSEQADDAPDLYDLGHRKQSTGGRIDRNGGDGMIGSFAIQRDVNLGFSAY